MTVMVQDNFNGTQDPDVYESPLEALTKMFETGLGKDADIGTFVNKEDGSQWVNIEFSVDGHITHSFCISKDLT